LNRLLSQRVERIELLLHLPLRLECLLALSLQPHRRVLPARLPQRSYGIERLCPRLCYLPLEDGSLLRHRLRLGLSGDCRGL